MKNRNEVVRLILLDFLESKLCTYGFEKTDKSYEWINGIPTFKNEKIQICFAGYFYAKAEGLK